MDKLQEDLQKQKAALTVFFKDRLPNKLEEEAVKLIDDNFNKEEYADTGNKWASRIGDDEANNPREERRGLLLKSGDLRRSVDVIRVGELIYIGTDSEYAQIHNEGLQGRAWGKHPFKMPKRQFMPIPGEDMPKAFDDRMDDFINSEMDKIMN